ncbi:hypothetical protein DASC09_048580 [Saccharomycopsis crataegensis]|uniref:RIC1 C-terminal alpha solenoid region domain-containing protein n=1 Tax=Saccharomycopsis crataegensis TaxID=43959 RepID=A0AAV5QRJ2_9ASCO|nr:hypothetical protein DASC09_048580 [Saccharomycopsis crataegensis]
MFWPLVTPSELDITDLVNGDSLIQIATPSADPRTPFAIISKTSIYVVNQQPLTILASHIRSPESIESYGFNVSMKTIVEPPSKLHASSSSSNSKVLIVQTEKNYLMVYSINGPTVNRDSKYELLQVYDKTGSDHLIQDVYPVDKTLSFFNFSSFSGGDTNQYRNDKINGVKFLESDFEDETTRIYDSGLKFRLVLKISNDLKGYQLMPDGHLCIITNKKSNENSQEEEEEQQQQQKSPSSDTIANNLAIQTINIRGSQETVKSCFIDEFPWFNEPDLQSIKYFTYNEKWDLFAFITNSGNCWMFKSTNPKNRLDFTQTTGNCVYRLGNAKQVLVNGTFNLVLIVTSNDDIFYYNMNHTRQKSPGFQIQLIKKFKKPLNSKKILSVKFSKLENLLLVSYSNGWCLLSIFGNINFSTFDYDDNLGITGVNASSGNNNRMGSHNWFTKVKDLDVYCNDSCLLVINDYGLYSFKLLKWSCLDVQSDLSTKRPVLYHESMIYIFNGIDDTTEASSIPEISETTKELTKGFNILDIPIYRYSLVKPIKMVSVSKNGLNLAIYGGNSYNFDRDIVDNAFNDTNKNNLLVYSFDTNTWHRFIDSYYDSLNIGCNILWWQNEYVFVDNYNPDTNHYEILMLNVGKVFKSVGKSSRSRATMNSNGHSSDRGRKDQRVADDGRNDPVGEIGSVTEFDSQCIIWRYEIGPTPVKYINLDNSLDELIIMTSDMKLVIFKLDQQTVGKTKDSSTDEMDSANDYKVYRKQVSINLIIKLSLKNLHIDVDSLGNFNLIKISQFSNDLLMLVNGNLYLLSLVKDESGDRAAVYSYEMFLVYNNIEFVNKINNESFYFFNGDDVLYLDDLDMQYNKNHLVSHGITSEITTRSASMLAKINKLRSLKISNFDEQFYPIFMNSTKNYYITGLTVDIVSISRRGQDLLGEQEKILKLLTTKKFFLHDLISFELDKVIVANDGEVMEAQLDAKLVEIFDKYHHCGNFEYSLEMLLYMVTTKDNENDSHSNTDFKLRLLLVLIKKLKLNYLSIIAKCLRKIEVEYWDRVFDQLNLTSKQLLHECIRIKDYKTAGYYLIILLSHKTTTTIVQEEEEIDESDKQEIMSLLKIMVENFDDPKYNKNNELWDMAIELIRFLKVLDGSGEILQQSITFLSSG